MAGQGSRTLKLSILGDIDNLKKSLDQGTTEVSTFGDKVGKFGKVAGAAFAAAGVAAVGAAGVAQHQSGRHCRADHAQIQRRRNACSGERGRRRH